VLALWAVFDSVVSKLEGEKMLTLLEQFAVTQILGVLQLVIKNPASKLTLQTTLLGIMNDIAFLYGYQISAPVALPATAAEPATRGFATRPGNPDPAAFVPAGERRPIS
jgi:hypothetical protein